MIYIIGDTETTGLGPTRKAVEIALKQVDAHMNTLQEWHSLIDPEIPIEPGAQAVHGITAEMVAHEPTMEEFITHVLGKPFEEDICLIGHNVSFDYPMLKVIGNITHTVCSLELARAYIQGPANYKLQTLREFFNIEEDHAHSAMGDVNITQQILKKVIEISGRSLEAHALTEARVVHWMSFGKHAGKSLFDLPLGYINWLLGLPELDQNLRDSLEIAKALK